MQICNNFFVTHEQNNLELLLNHKFRVRDTRVDSWPGEGGREFLWGRSILFLKFLNKLMQIESDFRGRKCLFRKFQAPTDVYLRLFTIKLRWFTIKIHSN